MAEIGIRLTADPSDLIAATKRAEDAFREWEISSAAGADDVADRLEEVIRSAVDLGKKLGRSSDDIQRDLEAMGFSADDAKDAINAVEREARDLGKASSSVAEVDDAIKGVGDAADTAETKTRGISDAADSVSEGLRGVGDIARSALEGDLGGAADSAAGLLGSIIGIAGIGGIAGAAGAAAGEFGLGLITSVIRAQQEEADRLKERLSSAYSEAAQSGRNYLDTAQLINEAMDLMFNTERAAEWKQVQEDAVTLGLDQNTVIRANSGDLEAQKLVIEQIEEAQTRANESAGEGRQESITGLSEEQRELIGVADRWKDITEATQESADKADLARQVTSSYLLEAVQGAESYKTAVDEVGNAVITLPDGKEIFIDAQTGLATDNLDGVQGELTELPEGVSITVDAATGEATLNLEGVQAEADETGQKKPTVVAGADTGTALLLLQELQDRHIPDKTVFVNADTSSAQATIDSLRNQAITIAINAVTNVFGSKEPFDG